MMKSTLLRALPALTALILVSAVTIAEAHDISVPDTGINGAGARNLARHYLNSLGYSRLGTSAKTALVKKAELRMGTWVVQVRTGGRQPTKSGVVLVDAKSGLIKTSLD